ncbi:hypothetical protein ACFL4T_03090 [candidate division KSB1 bacterium]
MKKNRFVFLIFFVIIAVSTGTFAQSNTDCLSCHSEKDFSTENEKGEEISLYVDNSLYSETSHGEMSCVDCHAALEGTDDSGHDSPVKKVDCSLCHEDESEVYGTSIHGTLLNVGDTESPTCSGCHGKHNIFSPDDERSTVNKFNLMYTCAVCHENRELQKTRQFARPDALPQFYESMHAKGLLKDGLIVSPSCNDCHGVHDIKVSSDPTSLINKRNVYKTCGKCHTRVESVYEKSIHGKLVESGDKRGPVCIDCHESHQIIDPMDAGFKQYSDKKCGQCHEEMLERYHETFHGKAMALGSTDIAACYDCHGYHDIVEIDNPESHVYGKNKVETCRKCHENTSENFAGYITHADHMDKEKNPYLYYTFLFMTVLLVGVFVFFGLHTLLWVVRSIALYIRDSKTFREAKVKVIKSDKIYVRFNPLERILHVMLIYSFTILVLTGMPLKFFNTGWARTLMGLLGGVETAGYLHRVAALIMVLMFAIHVFSLFKNFIPKISTFKNPETGRYSLKVFINYLFRPDSIIPSLKDVSDFWNHQKWFFGKGEKPKFDRWTYWEKFDYFAVFWGMVIIGISGFVMWLPGLFTKVFPGWIINVAMIIHSDEALLAAGFIFTFHFFNVHFRIEKFPMDTIIFSGRMSHAELVEEREAWMDRLEKDGKLDELKLKDTSASWQPIFKSFGFLAFGTGVVLAIAIFITMFVRLLQQ